MAKKVLFEIEVDSNFQELNKFEESLRQLKKERQDLIKLAKTEKGLKESEKKELTSLNEQIKIQTAESRKLSKAVQQKAKEENNLVNIYEKESARLNDLRKQLKNKLLTDEANADSTRKLADEIEELDKKLKDVDAQAGQFQRNVGNYPKATGAAKSGLSSLSGFLLGAFLGSLSKSSGESIELQLAIESIGEVARVTFAALKTFTLNIAIPTIENFYLSTKKFILGAKLQWIELKEFFTNGNEAGAIKKEIKLLTAEIDKNSDKIENSATGFENYADKIKNTNERLRELLILERDLNFERANSELLIESLSGAEEQYQIIADDTTKTFAEREKAARKVQETQKKRIDEQLRLATKEQDIAVKAIKNDLERYGLLNNFTEQEIRNLEVLKNKQAIEAIGLENLEKLKTSTIGLQTIQNDGIKIEKEIAKTSAELKQDRLERDLDFAIDVFDSQKTLNEKIIADETKTEAERIAILERTRDLSDASFKEQERIIQAFTDKKVDLNSLIAIEDEKTQLAEIRRLGFSEIIEGRIMEIIKEKRMVKQDLIDTEKDLMKTITERQNSEEDAEFDLMKFRKEVEIAKLKESKQTVKIRKETISKEKQLIALMTSYEIEQINKTTLSEKEKKDRIVKLKEEELEEIRKLEAEAAKEKAQKEEEQKEALKELGFNIAQETSDAIFEINKQNADREKQYALDQFEIRNQRQQELLESRLESGLISQAEYENNRIALAEKQAEERRRIEEDAFNKKKKLDTAQALINGALAITKTFAQLGFPAGAIAAAGVAASTAIQVGTIQSQKFAKGGLINGASHEQGGVPALVDGKRPIEVEGGEAIINKKSVAMFGEQLNYINKAGGGVPLFEKGGYIPKFANGGLASSSGGVSNLDLEKQAKMIISGINSKKVINIASETVNTYANAQSIENEFTL